MKRLLSGADGNVGARLFTCITVVLLWGHVAVSGCENNYGMDLFRCGPFSPVAQNCTNATSLDVPEQQPCRRVCHPEDCLLSTKWELELLDGPNRFGVIDNKIVCIDKITQKSQRKGCYDKAKFDNVTRTFLEQYVYRHGISLLPQFHSPVYRVQSTGSAVLFPTLLRHNRFSLCVKFALSEKLNTSFATSLLSFTISERELFRVSIFTKGRIYIQSLYKAAAVYKSPSPFKVGLVTSLCVSYRCQPKIETSMWIRTQGELLTELRPVYVSPFSNLASLLGNSASLLGIVSVGESPLMSPKGYPSFIGDVHSISVLDRFLFTKKEVLPFIRCEDSPLDTMKSVASGAVGMSIWENEPVNKTVWSPVPELLGNVTVRNGSAEDTVLFCGDQCASCKTRCMVADTDCSFIKSCASCEELSCPDSSHYKRTYKDTCSNDPVLDACNSTALQNCFTRTNNTCRDLDNALSCLRRIDLDGCTHHMWTDIPEEMDIFLTYGECEDPFSTRYSKISELSNLVFSYRHQMSECGQACVMSSGLWDLSVTHIPSFHRKLKMSDNAALCSSVSNYLDCVESDGCPEQEVQDTDYTYLHSRVSWIYPTVERLFMILNGGCKLPAECSDLLNTPHGQRALKNVKSYNSKRRHKLPKKGSNLKTANMWRQIKLPTRHEISRCKKRAQNTTLVLTRQQAENNLNRRNRQRHTKRRLSKRTVVTGKSGYIPAGYQVLLDTDPVLQQRFQRRGLAAKRQDTDGVGEDEDEMSTEEETVTEGHVEEETGTEERTSSVDRAEEEGDTAEETSADDQEDDIISFESQVEGNVSTVEQGNETRVDEPCANVTITKAQIGKVTITEVQTGNVTMTKVQIGNITITEIQQGNETMAEVQIGNATFYTPANEESIESGSSSTWGFPGGLLVALLSLLM